MQLVEDHRHDHSGDRDRGTDEPAPVARYEMANEGCLPHLDIDRNFAHRNASALRGQARYRNPKAHAQDQALVTSFHGADVELPCGRPVLGDALLLVAVGRNQNPLPLSFTAISGAVSISSS